MKFNGGKGVRNSDIGRSREEGEGRVDWSWDSEPNQRHLLGAVNNTSETNKECATQPFPPPLNDYNMWICPYIKATATWMNDLVG